MVLSWSPLVILGGLHSIFGVKPLSLVLILLGFALVAIYFVTKGIAHPLEKLTTAVITASKTWNPAQSVELGSKDEIEQLSASFQGMASRVEEITKMASGVAEGNFDQKVEIKSEQDAFGKTFNSMMVNIRNSREALLESKERFKSLVAQVPFGLTLIGADGGKYEYINPKFTEIFGYALEDTPSGKDWFRKAYPDREYRQKVIATWKGDLNGGKTGNSRPRVFTVTCKDGSTKEIIFRWSTLTNGGRLVTYEDITERRVAEQALKESEEKYRSLFEASKDPLFITTKDGSFVDLNGAMVQLLAYSSKEELMKIKVAQTYYNPDDRAKFQETMARQNYVEDMELELKSKDGRKIHALLTVNTRKDQKGNIIGYKGTMKDISERKKTEEALQRSEEAFRELYDDAPVGYHEYDSGGHITRVNRTYLGMLGYTAEEMIGQPLWKFYVEGEKAKEQILEKLAGSKPPGRSLERTYRRKDGTTFPALIEDRLMLDEKGQIMGMRCTVQDFTEHKRAEEALRHSEEKYRSILESMEEGYYEVDLAGNFTFVNDSTVRIFGYPRKELIGMNNRRYTDKENGTRLFQAFNHVYKTGEHVKECVYEVIRKDGTKRIIETSPLLRRDPSGKPIGFRGIARDVTERKQAEEALRQSEEKYRDILESMDEGYYEVDLAGNLTYVNGSTCRMHGYSKEELIGMNNRQWTDKENAKKLFQAFNKVYQDSESGAVCDYELIRKDGARRCGEVSIALRKDRSGKPIGFRGLLRDITEQKRAEEALQKS